MAFTLWIFCLDAQDNLYLLFHFKNYYFALSH